MPDNENSCRTGTGSSTLQGRALLIYREGNEWGVRATDEQEETAVAGILQFAPVRGVVLEGGLHPTIYLLNNRQQLYGLRLFLALRTQPTRNILPVTLQEGMEQAQLRKLQVDDHTWKEPSRGRQESLGQ